MKLKQRLLVFAALGPAISFAITAVELLATSLAKAAFSADYPGFPVGQFLATAGRHALSPAFLALCALFGVPAALSGLAVDMAERYERTDPALAVAACCAAVTLMAILPGFLTVLVFASPIGGVAAGLIAGAGAVLACWLAAPREAAPAPPPPPRPIVIDPYAYRADQPAVFGRR